MKLFNNTEPDLRRAAALLAAGGLVAFPTETVYGLGGDAFNPRALAAIFAAKGRPRFDPLIIHIAETAALERIADLGALTAGGRRALDTLTGRFWPGPLTLVLPKRPEVPDLATSGLPTAAVRFPSHPGARRLILWSTGAVAAPSANLFGRLSPTEASHVLEQLGDRVDAIIDGGRSSLGVESTVLSLSGDEARILRHGGLPQEAIEEAIGPVQAIPAGASPEAAAGGAVPGRESPGLLKSHYAPALPLALFPRGALERHLPAPGEGLLFFDAPALSRARSNFPAAFPPGPAARALSETGDTAEAASNLFAALHALEKLPLFRLLAEEAPPEGLGAAINDRLRRGAV